MLKLKKFALIGLSAVVLSACAGEAAKETEVSSTPPADEHSSVMEESSSVEVESVESAAVESSEKNASENRVYGKLNNQKAEQTSDNLYKEEVTPFMDVIYVTVENENIYLVDIDISELPSDLNLDKQHLTDLAADYMEEDSSLIQTKSDTDFIFESSSIEEKYEVIYTLDDQGQVIGITVATVQ